MIFHPLSFLKLWSFACTLSMRQKQFLNLTVANPLCRHPSARADPYHRPGSWRPGPCRPSRDFSTLCPLFDRELLSHLYTGRQCIPTTTPLNSSWTLGAPFPSYILLSHACVGNVFVHVFCWAVCYCFILYKLKSLECRREIPLSLQTKQLPDIATETEHRLAATLTKRALSQIHLSTFTRSVLHAWTWILDRASI